MRRRTSGTPASEDRERELEEQLASDLPATDMAVYLDALYFRLDENRFYVPVSLIVPGSQIPFVKGGDKDKATLDMIGEVIDEGKRPIGHARETVKLNLDPSLAGAAKKYSIHHQLQPAAGQVPAEVCGARKSDRADGFVRGRDYAAGDEEDAVEDEFHRAGFDAPAEQAAEPAGPQGRGIRAEHQPRLPPGPAPVSALRGLRSNARKSGGESAKGTKPGIDLLSSLELIQGSVKVYESSLVQAKAINVEGRDAVAVELDVPLKDLKPGPYVCQLNVIDDAGGSFAFPRFAVLVRAPAPTAAAPSNPGGSQ